MKIKKYILLLVLVFVLFSIKTKSQNQKFHNFYYRLFTIEHGLATSIIYCLYQDNNGNLWIGTIGGGINIYNGTFLSINKKNGLVGKSVYSITQDKNGAIWVSTDKGVSKIEGNISNKYLITNYTTKQGLPDNLVWKIFIDHSGKIWAGTGKGLAYLNNNKFEIFSTSSKLKEQSVFTIFEDNKYNLWIGTKNQGVFNIVGKNIIQYSTINKLSDNWVFTINQDRNNNILVGTSKGINLINDSIYCLPYPSTYTSSFKTSSGYILFTNYTGKIVNIVNNYKALNILYSTTGFPFRALLIDKEKNIWVGTETGLIQIPPSPFINWNEMQGINSNIYSIKNSNINNELWVGCAKNGAYYFRENNVDRRFYNFPSFKAIEMIEKKVTSNTIKKNLISNYVLSIVNDNKKRTWFGTITGISIFNPNDSNFIHITNDQNDKKYHCIINNKLNNKCINCLSKDYYGHIWCGTQSGITVFSDTSIISNNTELNKLNGISVYHIFHDKKRNVWFSTQKGLYSYNSKTLTHLKNNKTFEDEQINTVIQDNKDNYWIATKEGLFFYNLKESEKIDMSKGLIAENIFSLTIDKTNENLFIGTDHGLDKLNLKTFYSSKKIEIRHYGKYEGFLGIDCNRNANYIDSLGRIWLGTVDGITMYNPELDKINTVKPNTYITEILYNLDKIDWNEWSNYYDYIDSTTGLPVNLILPYDKNHITFKFSANSLTAPEKVLYQYMMQGIDTIWYKPISNDAGFPTLQPGKYTFKVKACNNDGLWNEIPTTFSFEISPPWYYTWYFIVSVVIVIIILIYIYIKYREAALRKDKFRLEKTVKERTTEVVKQKEIVEQKNKDITDSINYAKNIQEAVLPTKDEIFKHFPESFLLYKPRDIVSGDFYWISHKNNKTYFAIADCTGHGVPGAFMSMLGIAFMDEIIGINSTINASNMLNQLRENVILSLRQTGKQGESKDGMDISLIIFDIEKQEIEFAGANNPIYIVKKLTKNVILNESEESKLKIDVSTPLSMTKDSTPFSKKLELIELKGDNMPIGVHIKQHPFNSQIYKIEENDSVYMFSDGYADQFGGPSGKKFKYKQLKELLLKINHLPMSEQKMIINNAIIEWRGKEPQIDDIIISGIYFGKETLKSKTNKV